MSKRSVYAHRGYRVGVFLDSSNIHASARNHLGKDPDHARILHRALADNKLVRAIAYCVNMGGAFERWKHALSKYGFEFREKELQRFGDGGSKGDVDMEIAMDVWRAIDTIDMVVLVTGDGDFTELVKRCQECGKVVRVIGVPETTSHLLIDAADEFVPIDETMLRTPKSEQKEEAKK